MSSLAWWSLAFGAPVAVVGSVTAVATIAPRPIWLKLATGAVAIAMGLVVIGILGSITPESRSESYRAGFRYSLIASLFGIVAWRLVRSGRGSVRASPRPRKRAALAMALSTAGVVFPAFAVAGIALGWSAARHTQPDVAQPVGGRAAIRLGLVVLGFWAVILALAVLGG